MSVLEDIQRPIAEQVARYEQFVTSTLGSNSTFVNLICDYIMTNRGKQMRPLLVLLSAAMHGTIGERTYMGASLVEMIHTASLIHDDVVDESDLRRGIPSVRAMWDTRTAVLIGDFIFARTYHYCIGHGQIDILGEVTDSIHAVTEGELMQMEYSNTLSINEDIYFDIIGKKTASLIGAAAAVGALSVGASADAVDAMRRFGLYLGIAFQIKDDILDFSATEITGKPRGADIKEQKINLPLLYLIDNSSDKAAIIAEIAQARNNSQTVDLLCERVVNHGGIDYAKKRMEEYMELAIEQIEGYPQTEILNSLKSFASFVISRDK